MAQRDGSMAARLRISVNQSFGRGMVFENLRTIAAALSASSAARRAFLAARLARRAA